jgi:hypothetical protein
VLRYAQLPINNDATGDSVVLSLLWPQSSPETINTGRLRRNLPVHLLIDQESTVSGGGHRLTGFTVVYIFLY